MSKVCMISYQVARSYIILSLQSDAYRREGGGGLEICRPPPQEIEGGGLDLVSLLALNGMTFLKCDAIRWE